MSIAALGFFLRPVQFHHVLSLHRARASLDLLPQAVKPPPYFLSLNMSKDPVVPSLGPEAVSVKPRELVRESDICDKTGGSCMKTLAKQPQGVLRVQEQGVPSPPASGCQEFFNAGQCLPFHFRGTGLTFKPPQEKQQVGFNAQRSAND